MRTWSKALTLPEAKRATITLECRFLTWVFGGGEQPKRFDRVTRVRAPSVRGQLRFWWRTTHADLGVDELRLLEAAVFGSVHGGAPIASAVTLAVSRPPREPTRKDIFKQGDAFKLVDDGLKAIAYGAFPLRGTDASKTHDVLWNYGEGTFELEIGITRELDTLTSQLRDRDEKARADQLEGLLTRLERAYGQRPTTASELERALWAWLHFGGLGGRTRRGFGAVALVEAQGFTLKGIREGWPSFGHRKPAAWPVLPERADSIVAARPRTTGPQAQEVLLGLLHEVRQGPLGRTDNRPRPGRSYWPEPTALRRVHRMESGKHGTPVPPERVDAFPRAAFGAPVIFHFKTEPGEREPPDTTLVPAPVARLGKDGKEVVYGRLASPLVLRPHADGTSVTPLAIRLEHPAPARWALLVRKEVKAENVRAEVTPEEARRIKPLKVDGSTTNDPVTMYLRRLADR